MGVKSLNDVVEYITGLVSSIPKEVIVMVSAFLFLTFLLKSVARLLKLSIVVIAVSTVAYMVDPFIFDKIQRMPILADVGVFASNGIQTALSALKSI